MHEKIAIIDQKIVWYGSLNIFANATSTESMLRIVSANFYQNLLNSLPDLARNPSCPKCQGVVTRRYRGKSGKTYFQCLRCGKAFSR